MFLKTFSCPNDIATLVKDLEDLSDTLRTQMSKIENVLVEIDSQGVDPDNEKCEIDLITQSIKEFYRQKMKLYTTRKQQLRSNKCKRFVTI